MLTALKRRLPGVYFQTVVPVAEQGLPRMDIAGFVGFASQGPVNLPVPIEDVGRFRDIFGPDLELAWDEKTDRSETAYLSTAVESFFHNGGKRCWVVRVAHQNAHTHKFRVPTLIDAETGQPAVVQARCPGSWADHLRVSTRLQPEVIVSRRHGIGDEFTFDPTTGSFEIILAARSDQIRQGDLLHFAFNEDSGGLQQFRLYVTVSSLEPLPSDKLRVKGLSTHWFGRLDNSWPRQRIGVIEKATIINPANGAKDSIDVVIDNATGDTTPWIRVYVPPEGSDALCEVEFRYKTGAFKYVNHTPPKHGDILHLVVRYGPLETGEKQDLWLVVDKEASASVGAPWPAWYLDRVRNEEQKLWTSVIAGTRLWPIKGEDLQNEKLLSLKDKPYTLERSRFGLVVWEAQHLVASIEDLGFGEVEQSQVRLHEQESISNRFWANLPTDEVLFEQAQDRSDLLPAELARNASSPRFPLAGPDLPANAYIPFGMSTRLDYTTAQGCEVLTGTALERDGLANFNAGLFLGADFKNSTLSSLLNDANNKKYVEGGQLNGLYSLFHIDEISLFAIPDLSHRGWHRVQPDLEGVVQTPEDFGAGELTTAGTVQFSWRMDRSLVNDLYFELEESLDPAFAQPKIVYQDVKRSCVITLDQSRPTPRYYRLRAIVEKLASPWTKTLRLSTGTHAFGDADEPLQAVHFWRDSGEEGGGDLGDVLRWDKLKNPAFKYTIQSALDPAFHTAKMLRERVDENNFPLDTALRQNTYFRVRAEGPFPDNEKGPWSATILVRDPGLHQWIMHTIPEFDADQSLSQPLRDVHTSLLRFCGARADSIAALSVPHHYHEEQILTHLDMLSPLVSNSRTFLNAPSHTPADIPSLREDEGRALGYGSLYHPWTTPRLEGETAHEARFFPPDGTVCGVIAARANSHGAWTAPANIPFSGVLAMNPEISRTGWSRLLQRQVNVLRSDPRGFMALSADTLSISSDLRSLNVRRLMILIRRMALRAGNDFVFRSNDAELRNQVRHHFEDMLNKLYMLGAFKGATASEAYQVETGTAVNTPESIDRGRLIVELKVAPAKPLAFITVRLIQRDLSGFSVEEG